MWNKWSRRSVFRVIDCHHLPLSRSISSTDTKRKQSRALDDDDDDDRDDVSFGVVLVFALPAMAPRRRHFPVLEKNIAIAAFHFVFFVFRAAFCRRERKHQREKSETTTRKHVVRPHIVFFGATNATVRFFSLSLSLSLSLSFVVRVRKALCLAFFRRPPKNCVRRARIDRRGRRRRRRLQHRFS